MSSTISLVYDWTNVGMGRIELPVSSSRTKRDTDSLHSVRKAKLCLQYSHSEKCQAMLTVLVCPRSESN